MSSAMASPAPTSEQQMNTFRLRDKMSLLNSEFLQVLNGFYQEKNHYDFTSTMLSYMNHAKQLKEMYKVDDEVAVAMTTSHSPSVAAPKSNEVAPEKPVSIAQRKIAKASRRNGGSGSSTVTSDSPKIVNSTVFAASSPATVASVPKFGDISVIVKETPAPVSKATPLLEPSAPTARKRAIRGGGPLGGSESVIFKSGNDEPKASTSTIQIPATTIKFPEPTKDFWTKKDTSSGGAAPSNSGSLFAFLGKDNDKSKEPAKFTGFSFGKKPEAECEAESKTETSPGKSLFGAFQKTSDDLPKSSLPLFGTTNKSDAASPPKPLVFGEPKEAGEDTSSSAPKPFSALSFGASLFGSSAAKSTTTAAPALSFGSGASTTSGSLFSGFGGLAQKAMENQAKPEGGDDEEAEYVPPKVETVEAEEPGAVFSSKVAVFKFSGKEYTKLGVGMLHVKDTDGKFSVLIRAATTTGTVWLNALCNKTMKATKIDEKGDRIRLTCPTSMTEMTTMMIRFGTAEGAKKFTDKIEEVTK